MSLGFADFGQQTKARGELFIFGSFEIETSVTS